MIPTLGKCGSDAWDVADPHPKRIRGNRHAARVFSSQGVLTGNLPRGRGLNLFDGYWTRDRIYLADEDEDGLPIIRVFRIVKT